MKNRKAGALVVALALTVAGARAATYNGDLIVGFSDSVGNDLIYDLGAAGSLVNNQQWNLASVLSTFNLAGVKWGVVGAARVASGPTSWVTSPAGPPQSVPSNGRWGTIYNAIAAMYSRFNTAGAGQFVSINPLDDNSWNQQTINGTLTTQYHDVYEDPNTFGTNCTSFYSAVSSNLPPVLVGNFCLGANGVLTFTTPSAAPPPPSLQISRTGNASTISFLGTNNVTYTLYYTNAAGLGTPTASWPSLPGTITGNNAPTNFTDTTTDTDRVYRVQAQ